MGRGSGKTTASDNVLFGNVGPRRAAPEEPWVKEIAIKRLLETADQPGNREQLRELLEEHELARTLDFEDQLLQRMMDEAWDLVGLTKRLEGQQANEELDQLSDEEAGQRLRETVAFSETLLRRAGHCIDRASLHTLLYWTLSTDLRFGAGRDWFHGRLERLIETSGLEHRRKPLEVVVGNRFRRSRHYKALNYEEEKRTACGISTEGREYSNRNEIGGAMLCQACENIAHNSPDVLPRRVEPVTEQARRLWALEWQKAVDHLAQELQESGPMGAKEFEEFKQGSIWSNCVVGPLFADLGKKGPLYDHFAGNGGMERVEVANELLRFGSEQGDWAGPDLPEIEF